MEILIAGLAPHPPVSISEIGGERKVQELLLIVLIIYFEAAPLQVVLLIKL
ncbi:MAG: hypothetical protein MI740_03295 [Halanaerobiales bacterium]|nr:hypothetical protein [Halanaerobiales bacterium]